MIAFEKFGQHQLLNRQADRYPLEGAPIVLSTMADAIGSICAALDPLRRLIEAHVMAAERLHGDDTTGQGDQLHAEALAGLSRCSSKTGAFVSQTTPPNAACAELPSVVNHGCSAAPIAGASAPPRCIASSSQQR
jgi:hypothetical protein